jgi:hypothetical protein
MFFFLLLSSFLFLFFFFSVAEVRLWVSWLVACCLSALVLPARSLPPPPLQCVCPFRGHPADLTRRAFSRRQRGVCNCSGGGVMLTEMPTEFLGRFARVAGDADRSDAIHPPTPAGIPFLCAMKMTMLMTLMSCLLSAVRCYGHPPISTYRAPWSRACRTHSLAHSIAIRDMTAAD